MPDFDKNLNPILANTQKALPVLDNPATPVPSDYAPLTSGGNLRQAEVDPIFGKGPVVSKMLPTVSAGELYGNRRYATYDANIIDIEDQKAYAQSNLDKATNGVLKGLNLAATTVAGGFGMLYGAAKAPFSGRLADIWDNEVMRGLDEYNNEVDQNWLPNYYTNVEKNAKWYSTDNWFKTNFLFDKLIKNSGFAVGAMLSGNIANAALKGTGAVIGGLAAEGAMAAEASQAFKIFTPLLRNTARAFSSGKNIEAAAILEREISSIADVTTKASELAKIAQTTNQFSKFGEAARRTAIAVYSSAGESSFEALQAQKQFRDNLIQQWKDSHNGEDPIGEDLNKIDKYSESVGKTSFLANLAVLGITEYAQLPKLIGSSYSAEKQAANSLLGQTEEVLLEKGKYITKPGPKTLFGKIIDRSGKVSKYVFDPKEGFQESVQQIIQTGTQNYYNKAYQSKAADVWVDGFLHGAVGENEKGEGVGAFNSKEGWESFILGGLTGGMMQIKGNIQEARALKSNTQQFVDGLNNAPTFRDSFKDRLAAANRGVVLQEQQQNAIMQGDKLESMDLNADMMHNYLAPRIKYGRFDMVMDDIQDLKRNGSTEQGLASLKQQGLANINDTVESYAKRLNNFERTAKNTEQLYKSTNLRFGGEILKDAAGAPILDENGKQQRKYSPATIDKMIYAASKVADYDLRIPEVSTIALSKGIDVQSIVDSELSDDSSTALASQLNELDKNGDPISTPDVKQSLKDVIEMSLRRRQFLDEYRDMTENPAKYDETGERKEFNEQGKKLKTTPTKEGDSKYSAMSRLPFKGDKRTYDDLVQQYGEGEQSKYDVLKKIIASPFATTMEKELAAQFLKYTDRNSKIILGDRTLPNPGVSVTSMTSPTDAVSRINYEYNSDDYEGETMPVEYVMLHEIGHDLTVYALNDPNNPFYKELEPLFNFVQEHFKNDENKYAKNGLIKGGEFYAFKNIKEFATEALSNRDFQRYLDTIPYKNTQRSVWENFIGNLKTFFRRLFGINSDSALDEVVGIVTNNIDKVYKSQKDQNKRLTEEEEKAAAEALEIKKNAEKIEKQITQIELNSGDNGTPEDASIEVSTIPEGKLKSAAEFFAAGISESEKEDVSQDAVHVRNSREFLNNAKNFKNRENLRAFLVTPNQEKALGLEGLTALSYNGEDMSKSTDIDEGLVAQVFIEQDGGKTYFIDKNGERLGEVGQPVDVSKVIFQTMPTTDIFYKGTDKDGKPIPRYRTGEKEAFEAYSKAWRIKREQLFKDAGTAIKTYRFNISRGIAIETPKVNGKYSRNHVGDIVIPENKISRQQELVIVPVDGNVYHQGKNIQFPKGTPVIQYGDTLFFLKNALLGKEKAQNVYQVIKAMSDEFLKTKDINPKYAEYLQNVLYLRTKGGTTKAGSNQIFIDAKSAEIFLGGKRYAINDIANREKEITEQLTNTYHNTNNFTLSKKFSAPFYEFVAKDGELKEVEWKNYQSYLLASKNPDGSARNVDSTPLTTTLEKPTNLRPYSFKQKYATLVDFEFPVVPVVKPAPTVTATPTVTSTTKLGEFEMDGKTKNTFNEFNSGPVDFTGTIDENGNITVDVLQNDTIIKVAKNEKLLNEAIIPALKAANTYDASADDVELVSTFVANKLVLELKKLQQAVPAAPVVQPTAPVVTPTPVSNVPKKSELEGSSSFVEAIGTLNKRLENGEFTVSNSNVVIKLDPNGNFIGYVTKDALGNSIIEKGKRPSTEADLTDVNKQRDSIVKQLEILNSPIVKKLDSLFVNLGAKNLEEFLGAFSFKQRGNLAKINDRFISDYYLSNYEKLKSIEKEINAKYDAESKALTEVPVSTDIKADIERKRQEDLSLISEDDYLTNTNKTLEGLEDGKVVRFEGASYYVLDGAATVNGIPNVSSSGSISSAKRIIDAVNAKYDAELAALEGKPAEPGKYNPNNTSAPDDEYQRVGVDVSQERLTDSEIAAFKEWHAQNAPGIPFEVLDNIVTTHDNQQAFGVFQEGVAKFYKGALKATPYHEIGEGIWKAFLTPEQRQAIIDEQRSTGEDFIDRETGKTLNYATATDKQIKERIMDDFGEFKAGKIRATSLSERILNFFRNIINFFKSFGQKPSLKDELFKAIDSGKFKDFKVSDVVRTDSMAEYSRIPGLTETQKFEYVQDMLSRAANYIFGQNKRSLFDISKITSNELFDHIKGLYEKENKYQELGEERWNMLVTKTKQALRTFGVNFNEEERIDINDENTNSKEYTSDPFTTDWKKSSPFAIKLTLATLPEVLPKNQQNADPTKLPTRKGSSIKGYLLNNFSRAFATVLNKLSNTSKISKVVNKLSQLGKDDPTYVRFFQRVGGDIATGTINFGKFEDEDWRLFVNMMQVFTKQKPEALIQYMDGGSVYTAPANQFTAAKKIEQGWYDNMKALARVPSSIIKYNSNKTYSVNTDSKFFPKASPKVAEEMINFLTDLGIGVDMNLYNSMKDKQKKEFSEAVGQIYNYLQGTKEIGTITGKTLGINSQLAKISNMVVTLTNPNQENTLFGVEGKRMQAYSDNNLPSVFENEFNDVSTLEELIKERPELNDVFSKNSVVLKEGGEFFNEEGERVKSLKVKYIQGTKDLNNDKGTATAKLTLGNRFTQELNQNLNGDYYILVPADSSTEWMINLGNHILFSDVASGRAANKINKIFKGYLIDDIALALDGRNQKNVGNKSKELRFFKDFLSEKDANGEERSEVLKGINDMIQAGRTLDDITAFISEKANEEMINNAIQKFINDTVTESKKILSENGETFINVEDKLAYPNLNNDFVSSKDVNINKNAMTEKNLDDILYFANANYIMNNIEMHKLLFGDPYQFAVKKDGSLDETKRIKSFLSPRRTTFDSPEFNTFLNNHYNMAGDIQVEDGELGYHNHDSFTNTVTVSDVEVTTELYPEKFKVADAASWLQDNTYREIKLKNGQWSTEAEKWHQWQMAYTRQNLPGYEYKSEALRKQDEKLVKTPEPEFVTEILKPIVSGVKAGVTDINLVLDKFSQMPLYYKAVQGTNLGKLYEKMWKEKIGYVIVESGRKVGAVKLHNLYNEDGTFNEQPFAQDTMIKVPWKSYGIQVENSFENPKEQTRGSQLTKLSSLDFFNNGDATEVARKEYQRNKNILDRMHQNAYVELLNKLGIEDLGTAFRMADPTAISKTLEGEMFRRTMSENGIDTIQLNQDKQFPIPFEASPAYDQIKSIIYSMVNKSLISPKVNGAPHVQVPVTMWEKSGDKSSTTTLGFYSKGKTQTNPCEVMLPHWFKERLNKKRFPNDQALLDYLNKTEEGRSILTGIGFRIPTQAMSSTEVFKVKGFLPKSMGYSVVVPAEITAKTGSDFDIDKLNMYLKATYIDKNGDIRLIRLMDDEAKTKEFFSGVFDEKLEKKKLNKAELLEATQILSYGLEDPNNLVEKYADILDPILEGAEDSSEYEQMVMDELEKLGDANLQTALKEKFVNNMYKKALENEYYDSLEKMILLPENFDRLVAPIGDGGLKGMAKKLDSLRGEDESKIKNRLLDRNYMTSLRNAFVMAKKWVGISAVNITGQSVTQKSKVYIDPARFELTDEFDEKILGDGNIVLPHNTIKIGDKEYISISGNKTADGKEYISDRLSGYATAFVDVAKDPYIMKIVRSNSIVGTFMFLERIGAGEKGIEFLNQPIITEYLKYLDSIGKTGLFGKMDGELIKDMFPTTGAALASTSINTNNFTKNIEDYANQSLTPEQNAEQQKIFDEFLKYAKMAQYSFKLTQATNYDTTKFTSGDTLFRKQYRTRVAKESNIFSSVGKILNTTFMGEQARLIDKSMEGVGAILKLEQPEFRDITDQVLEKYAKQEYMSDDDYEKIGNKIKASFLDYVIQIKSGISNDIKTLLVDSTSSIDVQLAEAKKKYPEMKLLQNLTTESSKRMNGAKTIKLVANNRGDAMDENMYIEMMRELKEVDLQLYNNIVTVAILQGTYQSSVSIRNIIPVEDFSARIAPIINKLANTEDVKAFSKGAFQRNNWKDESVVPTLERIRFNPMTDQNGNELDPVGEQVDRFGDHVADIYRYVSPMFPDQILSARSIERKVLKLHPSYYRIAIDNDFIKIPRVITSTKNNQKIDMVTGLTITDQSYKDRKAVNDLSLYDYFGYEKVKDELGQPLVTNNGEYIYKLINLYGDGQYASEYHLDGQPSPIDNGTIKIDNEIPNKDLIQFFAPKTEEKVLPSQPVQISGPLKGQMTYSYGNNKRADVTADTTFDAILNGERTATTRYTSDGNLDYWKQAKVGDIITWDSGDGRTVNVEVTKALAPLKGSGKTAEEWSKLEGWSKEYFEKKVRPKLDQAWQMEYKLAQPTETVSGKEFKIEKPVPGVENIANSGLTIEQSNQFIDLLQPQILNQAYVENKAKTANMMFSFGLRWAKNIPNESEKSEQAKNLGKPRPNRKTIKSKEGMTYGYYLTDQNNKPLPSIKELQPIMDFIQSKLGIDMSNYDAMLGNIYDNNSFIHQHRDTTESVTAEGYPVIVVNLGANGHLEYDKDVKSTYASYKKSGQLDLANGGIYAFGVDGENRFTFHHRIGSGLESETPLKPITLPNGEVLKDYRITLTFRRASDLEQGMPATPAKISKEAVSSKRISTPSGKLKLKDGKEYLISDINSELLKSIGYKPAEIGKLLKSIC